VAPAADDGGTLQKVAPRGGHCHGLAESREGVSSWEGALQRLLSFSVKRTDQRSTTSPKIRPVTRKLFPRGLNSPVTG
jgi:hypothetical protein